ncbi:MAG: lipocalin family protein [Candidatus Nitronauta litoralis]|uniref:Lipocalin family protein n=1 Tax=Candidatus Nitronauta litoralis TaxID=2705533 RepID=A0A7T0G154_9BACT|nr:MAG: lipocalin family protein [Candidatus Nitronauta litoralis]
MRIFSIRFYKRIIQVGLVIFMAACAHAPDTSKPPLVVVPYVDYKQYVGTWYEIARFTHFFEEGCVAATATYRLMRDGKHIEVINRCHEGTVDGPLKEAQAKAWVEDPPIQAKLKVQFFWPFVGDYWIIDLAPDYRYAVVSAPDRDYLWILSRTPQMNPTDYDTVIANLKTQRFDLTRLEHPPQIR